MASNKMAGEAAPINGVDNIDVVRDGDSGSSRVDDDDDDENDDDNAERENDDGPSGGPSPSPPTALPKVVDPTTKQTKPQPSTNTTTAARTQNQKQTQTHRTRPRPSSPRPQSPIDTTSTTILPLPLPLPLRTTSRTRTRRLRGDVLPKDTGQTTNTVLKTPLKTRPTRPPLLDLQPLQNLGPIIRPLPLPPGTAPPRAQLAVQLKMNLEIEVTLKARVCGDILLSIL